jgi:hypothetical protein
VPLLYRVKQSHHCAVVELSPTWFAPLAVSISYLRFVPR